MNAVEICFMLIFLRKNQYREHEFIIHERITLDFKIK